MIHPRTGSERLRVGHRTFDFVWHFFLKDNVRFSLQWPIKVSDQTLTGKQLSAVCFIEPDESSWLEQIFIQILMVYHLSMIL